MTAICLSTIRVDKPWGRNDLWSGFDNPSGAKIGEIWFDAPPGVEAELMVKYLFTNEKLSIQVHPNDEQARAAGYPRGKEEAWLVLAAEPDSTVALGTVRALSGDELRRAALDGSIEALVDWKPVKAGDVIYSAAGTVHAIGAGITLIEVQQNVDLTYRLYDYGRPRELHLDAGVAVSLARPFIIPPVPGDIGEGRTLLVDSDKFRLERWDAHPRSIKGTRGWLIPVTGGGMIDDQNFTAGQCWMIEGRATVSPDAGSDTLFASAAPYEVGLCAS